MRTEDVIREALEREAERHRVNPALPKATIVKARASRASTAIVALSTVAAVAFGGVAVVGEVTDDARRGIAPAAGRSPETGAHAPEDAPLLLLSKEGWSVTRADQLDLDNGEMTFANGDAELVLTWRGVETHEDYVEDRAAEADGPWELTIAGRKAVLYRYRGTNDYTAMWTDGDHSLELRGVFPDVESYRAVATTLERVDSETFLASLPKDTVTPSRRADVVDGMLEDVPVHPRSKIDRLKDGRTMTDRYQLGARVTAAVACEWIADWVDGTEHGDEPKARRATEAMATSREWAILKEMQSQGGWSEVVWEYADAMTGKGEVMGGRPMTIAESYRAALGCDA